MYLLCLGILELSCDCNYNNHDLLNIFYPPSRYFLRPAMFLEDSSLKYVIGTVSLSVLKTMLCSAKLKNPSLSKYAFLFLLPFYYFRLSPDKYNRYTLHYKLNMYYCNTNIEVHVKPFEYALKCRAPITLHYVQI